MPGKVGRSRRLGFLPSSTRYRAIWTRQSLKKWNDQKKLRSKKKLTLYAAHVVEYHKRNIFRFQVQPKLSKWLLWPQMMVTVDFDRQLFESLPVNLKLTVWEHLQPSRQLLWEYSDQVLGILIAREKSDFLSVESPIWKDSSFKYFFF